MNVTINRNRALVLELRRISAAIERANELKELELIHVHGLTTRATAAATSELADTAVAYNDPAYTEMVRVLERRAGRQLSDEEAARLMEAVALENAEDD